MANDPFQSIKELLESGKTFIEEKKGQWDHIQWDSLLSDLQTKGANLTDEAKHRFGEALGVEPQVCGVPVHRFAGGGIDAAVGRPVQSPVECVRIDADGHRVDRPSDQPTRHPVARGQGEVGCADQSAHQRMMPRALASAMDCGVAPGSPSAIGTTATAVP